MHGPTDRRAGFMLVEVLAALLVTASLVAVVLPFAGRLIARWQTGQAAVVQADAWMQVIARLADDVAEAMPLHEPGRLDALAFAVESRRIDFVRPSLGGGGGALERVSYRVETVADGERLVRRAAPFSGEGDDGGGRAIGLIEGPYTFRFAALGRDGASGPWENLATLPLRVDLSITRRDGKPLPVSPVTLPIAARATVAKVVPLLRETTP